MFGSVFTADLLNRSAVFSIGVIAVAIVVGVVLSLIFWGGGGEKPKQAFSACFGCIIPPAWFSTGSIACGLSRYGESGRFNGGIGGYAPSGTIRKRSRALRMWVGVAVVVCVVLVLLLCCAVCVCVDGWFAD